MKHSLVKKIWVELVLYIVFIFIGIFLLSNPQLEVLGPLAYASTIFFIITFFLIIAYFMDRKEEDYELLFLALISLIVGNVILINELSHASNFILGISILFFVLLSAVNKFYHSYKLFNNFELEAYSKIIAGTLLCFLGLLVTSNLFHNLTMQTLILGYFFTTYGFICLLETLMKIVFRNKKIMSFMMSVLGFSTKKEKKKLLRVREEKIVKLQKSGKQKK